MEQRIIRGRAAGPLGEGRARGKAREERGPRRGSGLSTRNPARVTGGSGRRQSEQDLAQYIHTLPEFESS